MTAASVLHCFSDIRGLKDLPRVRDYQEKVTDALGIYTSTHYPSAPNKFGDLLLRLSEIAKTSALCREMLAKKDLPAEVSSFSLLMELLKTNPSMWARYELQKFISSTIYGGRYESNSPRVIECNSRDCWSTASVSIAVAKINISVSESLLDVWTCVLSSL